MFEPVLQIVHVSDMHIVAPGQPGPRLLRYLESRLRRTGPQALYEKLRDGTAPHDPFAPLHFARFLHEICGRDPSWANVPLWIVDTGDQTTYGDDASIRKAQAELAAFASAPRGSAPVVLHGRTYGNHDAWPGTMPCFGATRIAAQRTRIGTTYARGQATLAAQCPLPSGAEVHLYAIDTVDDRPTANTLARGHVDPTQLQQLASLVAASSGNGRPPALRLLATHHPVHYPPPRPPLQMAIRNDQHVGSFIAQGCPIHLVLSGHTHDLFPPHGGLPQSPRACHHPTLGTDQAQLVTGSLCQVDRLGKRQFAHQCQVLRVYQDPAQAGLVVVERLLAARNPTRGAGTLTGGAGPYRFVPLSGGAGVAEEIELAL